MQRKSYRDSHTSQNRGKKYDDIYKKDIYDSRVWILESQVLDHILKTKIKAPIKRYLDFACGTGRILEFFIDKVNNSTAIDISEEMLKVARKKFQSTKFLKIDIARNPIRFPEKFDIITAFRFFLNAEDDLRRNVLTALYKVISDEGFLILNIHNNKYSTTIFHNDETSIKTISLNEIKKIIHTHHFRIIKFYGISYLPYFFSALLSLKVWLIIERIIYKLRFLKIFARNLIFLCKKL